MTLGGVPVAGSAGGCAMFRTQVLTVACTLSPMASWPVGAVTVIAAVPLCPSLVAVIVADPAPAPLTSPLPLTVATAVVLLPHVTTRPLRAVPFASRGVAVSCTVAPCWTLADAGVTVTDATGTFDTVTTAVPLCPSLVAVIVAAPVATAVTSPLPFTLATAPLLDCQVMTRPVNGFPLASRGVAVSCVVSPICTVGAAGLTVTAATGATQPATVTVD